MRGKKKKKKIGTQTAGDHRSKNELNSYQEFWEKLLHSCHPQGLQIRKGERREKKKDKKAT